MCDLKMMMQLTRCRYGSALSTVLTALKDLGRGSAEKEFGEAQEIKRNALEALNWTLYVALEAKQVLIRQPPSGSCLF